MSIAIAACEGDGHSWVSNDDFVIFELLAKALGFTLSSHYCRRCGALGDACQRCDGSGVEGFDGEVYSSIAEDVCQFCDGAGVVPRLVADQAEAEKP